MRLVSLITQFFSAMTAVAKNVRGADAHMNTARGNSWRNRAAWSIESQRSSAFMMSVAVELRPGFTSATCVGPNTARTTSGLYERRAAMRPAQLRQMLGTDAHCGGVTMF